MPIPTDTDAVQVLTEVPVSARSADRMPLAENTPFRYWLDLGAVGLAGGEAHYVPIRVNIEPGIQNVPGSGDPTRIDGYQAGRLKRIAVPMDFACTAWGERTTGYMVRRVYDMDRNGKQLVHYHDVWTRYEMLGSRLIRSFDAEGWAQFCRDVSSIAQAPPHEQVVAAEVTRLRNSAAAHRRLAHQSPGAAEVADGIEKKIARPRKRRAKKTQPKTQPEATAE